MVTILMYYRRRASPKHRYKIIEDYDGGGHCTRLRDLKDQLLLCLEVPPAPVYKGAREGRGRPRRRARQGGSPTPTGSRIPPFLVGVGEKERGGEEEGKGGCTPCPIRTRGGRAPPSLPLYIRGQGAPLDTS